MKVLMISTDRTILEKGSSAWARMLDYGWLAEELHIIVFAKRNFQSISKIQLSRNCWAYPTNSFSRWFYIFDAVWIGRSIINASRSALDAFVITTQDPFETGLVGLRLAKKFKLPLNVQVHTDFLSPKYYRFSILNRIRVSIARRVLARANKIRVVSLRIQDSLTHDRRFKLPASRIIILPIFVDQERLLNQPNNIDIKLKYPGFDKYFVWVGRMEEEKHPELAIQAFESLVKRGIIACLVMVGDGKRLERMKKLVESRGLKGIYFEGVQSYLLGYYKSADALIVTSYYEGFGLVILEAAITLLPIVSTDVGVAREIGAVIVPPTREAFADALSRVGGRKVYSLPSYVCTDRDEYLKSFKQIFE